MQLARILLSYALVVGVLFSTLAGGVIWLLQPGPAVSQEARPAPIPQRIADSIERKKPFPVQEPAIGEPKPEPVKPAMLEANVSLAPTPASSSRFRQLSPPPREPRKRRSEPALARAAPPVPVSNSPAATVSAARSDFPY
jgi:hypothetical protein